MSNFLLDIDRASSVFALLFLFATESVPGDEDECAFDDALRDVLMGAKLPPEARDKVRIIFDRTLRSREEPGDLREAISRVEQDFRGQNDVLLAVLRIVLRLSTDEGMCCEGDKDRLREVVEIFNLSPLDFAKLSEVEQEVLLYCYGDARNDPFLRQEDLQHYQVLGCSHDAPDNELLKAYRKLVMKYHPDRAAVANGSDDSVRPCRRSFEQVQRSYRAICERRGIKV